MSEILLPGTPNDEFQIQKKIYTIRGLQVMIDTDLATLYGVETRRLNEQVKRNIARFPQEFRFQLTEEEAEVLRSQIATLEDRRGKHRKYLPYVFTEQGVSMLSAVLRSKTAIETSIRIIEAFVQMRKFISQNAGLFQRVQTLEKKQLATDEKLDKVFDAIEQKQLKPKQGIFFDGQVYDAYAFVSDLIKSAEHSIVLIDNYVDESVLTLLSKRTEGCSARIYTKTITRQLRLDLERHNTQYPAIGIEPFADAHDRFLILDGKTVYHIGASLKDLGKKWFAFSRFDKDVLDVLKRLENG